MINSAQVSHSANMELEENRLILMVSVGWTAQNFTTVPTCLCIAKVLLLTFVFLVQLDVSVTSLKYFKVLLLF